VTQPGQSVGDTGAGKVRAKQLAGRVVDPIARFMLRLHVSPDAVTVVGCLGASIGALWLGSTGRLVAAVLVVALFASSDMLDGSMARQAGRSGPWGAFLDSSLDRVTDAAVLGSLVIWYFRGGDDVVLACLALYCLVAGMLVSYVRARAEGLGFRAAGGLAERTERLVLLAITTLLAGAGVAYAQAFGFWVLAIASTITVFQRFVMVRRQAIDAGSAAASADD